jgi:hypothetical protein
MSSTETSGVPAEGTATQPAPAAAFPSFGTTRGSGLARGKRPSAAAATAASTAPSDYKPTAIEVVNAPREYTNPFAPAEAPVAEAAPAPARPEPVQETAPVIETVAPAAPAPVAEEPAELNILPPAEQKTAPAQTWESEGFRPARSERPERSERPRREERAEAPADEPVDIASIPEKFLYVRPGVTFVPTPRNWGGAPRERRSHNESAPRSEAPRASASSTPAATPAKSGGLLGWLKGLFGGSDESASAPVTTTTGGESGEARREGGHRRHRSDRGGRGGEGGGHRRHRGGRGRSRSHDGESQGSRQGGSI